MTTTLVPGSKCNPAIRWTLSAPQMLPATHGTIRRPGVDLVHMNVFVPFDAGNQFIFVDIRHSFFIDKVEKEDT